MSTACVPPCGNAPRPLPPVFAPPCLTCDELAALWPPPPSITITSLQPNASTINQNISLIIRGTGFTGSEIATVGATDYPTVFLSPTMLRVDGVATGPVPTTLQVLVKRGTTVSSQLPLTIT